MIIESCINCINCITLYNHPWNEKYKGSISNKANLHVCILEHDMDHNRKGTIMEHITIGCEMFIHIKQKEINKSNKVINKYIL